MGAATRIGLACAAVFTVSACTSVPVYDVRAALPPAPLEVRGRQIERAARIEDWTARRLASDTLVVSKRRGMHVASSTIVYGERGYSITLRNSVELGQSHGRIHRLYNRWVRELEAAIRFEAGLP